MKNERGEMIEGEGERKGERTRIPKCPDGDAELREGSGSRGAWRVTAQQRLSSVRLFSQILHSLRI